MHLKLLRHPYFRFQLFWHYRIFENHPCYFIISTPSIPSNQINGSKIANLEIEITALTEHIFILKESIEKINDTSPVDRNEPRIKGLAGRIRYLKEDNKNKIFVMKLLLETFDKHFASSNNFVTVCNRNKSNTEYVKTSLIPSPNQFKNLNTSTMKVFNRKFYIKTSLKIITNTLITNKKSIIALITSEKPSTISETVRQWISQIKLITSDRENIFTYTIDTWHKKLWKMMTKRTMLIAGDSLSKDTCSSTYSGRKYNVFVKCWT